MENNDIYEKMLMIFLDNKGPKPSGFAILLGDYRKNKGIRIDAGAWIRSDMARDAELLSAMRQAGSGSIRRVGG